MVSLAEQTENTFGPKPIEIPPMGLEAPLPDPYSSEMNKLRKKIFTEDLPKALPRVAKGVALSIPAIPFDLVDLAKLANDLNNQYGPDFITKSPVTKFFTKAIDKTQQTVGREQFSKLMKYIGVNDNPSDPAQLIGELSTVLIALPTAISKGLSKTSKVIPSKSTTALTKPKQTALSTKVDDTAPKVKYTKDVYHLGKGEIVGDKFDFMGDSDIGVHVGTQTHAKGASKKYFVEDGKTNDPTVDFVPDKKEDVLLKGTYKVKGQRTFPLQLADDLKPARVPDIGLFYKPKFWIDTLSIPSTDAYRMDVATTDAKGNETLEAMTKFQKKPTLEYKGVTYYMSDKAVNIDMDKKLWTDFVKAAVDQQAKFKKQNKEFFLNYQPFLTSKQIKAEGRRIFGSTERKEWFEKLKKITNDNGYNSLIYKNEKEASQTQKATDKYEDSFMLFEPDQVKYKFSETKTKGDPRLDKHKGGMI